MKLGILSIIGLILFTDILDTFGQLLLKSSVNLLNLHINTFKKAFHFTWKLLAIPKVWGGFLFSTASLVVWLFVLSKADLNFAFSLDSMRYILITLASGIFLKEKITRGRWLGVFCVVLGIALVAMG